MATGKSGLPKQLRLIVADDESVVTELTSGSLAAEFSEFTVVYNEQRRFDSKNVTYMVHSS